MESKALEEVLLGSKVQTKDASVGSSPVRLCPPPHLGQNGTE